MKPIDMHNNVSKTLNLNVKVKHYQANEMCISPGKLDYWFLNLPLVKHYASRQVLFIITFWIKKKAFLDGKKCQGTNGLLSFFIVYTNWCEIFVKQFKPGCSHDEIMK